MRVNAFAILFFALATSAGAHGHGGGRGAAAGGAGYSDDSQQYPQAPSMTLPQNGYNPSNDGTAPAVPAPTPSEPAAQPETGQPATQTESGETTAQPESGEPAAKSERDQPANASPLSGPQPEQDESQANTAETVPPVTLDSAQINFPTIVGTYLARHSSRGVWTVKDTSGRTWRLAGARTKSDTVRSDGNGLFSARVDLRTARPPTHRLEFDFTVDFSGDNWQVTRYRLVKVDGKTRK